MTRHRADTPEVIAARVFEVLDGFTAGAPLRDDLTLVVLKN